MMLARISIEMPLPMPRSVICSPSHIRKMVPPVRVKTASISNHGPSGSSTKSCPAVFCDSSQLAMK